MILKNLTKGIIMTKDLKEVRSFYNQLFGLLKKANPRSLLFKTRFGIHTFGLTEAIDVIVLNNDFKVVKLKENLKPNSLFFWNPKYNLVIELPKGTIKEDRVTLSCYLSFNLV